jgi:hypothetical protein
MGTSTDLSGGVAVLNIDGTLRWNARFERVGVTVDDLQFDAEGAVWIVGRAWRTVREGDQLRPVDETRAPGQVSRIGDGFLMRYDARGNLLFDEKITMRHNFFSGFLDVHTDTAYLMTTVVGDLPAAFGAPPRDRDRWSTLLMGFDRTGRVTRLKDTGGDLPGQVLARGDTVTMVVGKRRSYPDPKDPSELHQATDCELVRMELR